MDDFFKMITKFLVMTTRNLTSNIFNGPQGIWQEGLGESPPITSQRRRRDCSYIATQKCIIVSIKLCANAHLLLGIVEESILELLLKIGDLLHEWRREIFIKIFCELVHQISSATLFPNIVKLFISQNISL